LLFSSLTFLLYLMWIKCVCVLKFHYSSSGWSYITKVHRRAKL
jgi:hypothetical protein